MNQKNQVNVGKVIENSQFNKFFLVTCIISLFALMFDGFSQTVFGTALAAQIADTGLSPNLFGFIGTTTLYGMTAGAVIFGVLGDKIGRKTTIIIGIIGYCLTTGLYGLSNSPLMFGILRTLTGVFVIGIVPSILAQTLEYAPVKIRARMGLLTTLGVPIGTVLCSLLGIYIVPAFGWRMLYLISFIPIILAVVVYLFYPESMETLVKRGDKAAIRKILVKADPEFVPNENDEYYTEGTKQQSKASFSGLFKQGMAKNTILFIILLACAFFATYGLVTWLPKLMISAGGYPATVSLQFLFSFVLGSVPGIMLGSKMVYKLGYKKSICAFSSMGAVMSLILTMKPGFLVTCVLLFLIGAAIYSITGLLYSYLGSNYPNSIRSTAFGWTNGMGRFGGSFAPVVGGLLLTYQVSFPMSFIIFAFIPLMIAAILILFTEDFTELSNLSKR